MVVDVEEVPGSLNKTDVSAEWRVYCMERMAREVSRINGLVSTLVAVTIILADRRECMPELVVN